jgi:two-component system, OmpR family, response regulator
MSEVPNILVVDDHREIRESVARFLNRNGLRAATAKDTSEMDDQMRLRSFDLIVLDVMMPGEDGLSACKRLSAQSDIPILMLTALDGDDDLIRGLDTGADDYLSKPFNPRELLARINAILRRSHRAGRQFSALEGKRLGFSSVVFEVDARRITRADRRTEILTSGEAKLLTIFLERPRAVLSRDALLSLSAGRVAGPLDRAIDNQISRLRRKIEPDVLRPRIIATIRNGGYSLACDVEVLE